MSSFKEWIGAQELRGVSMGLDEALARTTKALKDARGEGEAEAGAVG